MAISSQRNKDHNRLFNRGQSRPLGLVFALFLSAALMLFDYHYQCLGAVRSTFALLASPLQYAVDYPIRSLAWARDMVSAKTKLIDDNMALHYRQTLLEAELQKLMAIQEENLQLKELLLTSSNARMKAMAAQID